MTINIENSTSLKITKIIENISKRDLNDVFIFDDISGKTITVKQFYRDVLSVESLMNERSLNKTLVLIMNNCYELIVIYFACLLTARVASPIDPKLGRERILEIIKDESDFSFITDEHWLIDEHAESNYALLFQKPTAIVNETSFISKLRLVKFNDLYLLTYTSGTSGKFKGVKNSAANLFLSAEAFCSLHGITNGKCFLHSMVMTYMAGILNTIFMPFVSNSSIVICERFSVDIAVKFWNIMKKYDINTLWLSPTMLALILKVNRGENGIAYCKENNVDWYIGTAPLAENLKQTFEEKYSVKLFQSYGLSETLFISSVTNKTHQSNKSSGVGELLEGVNIKYGDANELLLSVPWMFLGYSNEPTEDYFDGNLYRSGDIGKIEDGILFITERKKDLIIRGGINISAKAIEEVVLQNSHVNEALIVSVNDDLMGEIICCAVILNGDTELKLLQKEIKRAVKKLGNGYTIDRLIAVNEFTLNLNGKIDKLRMRELF